MIYTDVVYGSEEPEKVKIDPGEFLRRAGGGSLELPEVKSCKNVFDGKVSYRYAWARMELTFPEEGVCDFGCGIIESRDLYKNLRECREAYMMGVTLGAGIDRLLRTLGIKSPAEHFITDALASAAVESFCDMVDLSLREAVKAGNGGVCRPRYSPGYGDCDIKYQRLLTERINAEKTLGISLNESCFMTPSKSVTAIMGIKYE
ncbi:MAG: vitamin B12 dependent-methionine synthase activation domain-containing protein [Bacillota bacterium]|nr:vitamin B12 dependent-methionine synthase activation domain-containing protein [Bacillota bacterium]